MAFKEKLDAKSLEVFNAASEQPFQGQAIFFLNAFWAEHSEAAPFIYSVIWDQMIKKDMEARKFSYVHQYFNTDPPKKGAPQGGEGQELDFDISVAYFEQLCYIWSDQRQDKDVKEFLAGEKDWKTKFAAAQPDMMTSIVRKKELKEKVDVNFNGKMSMLEFLLYQFKCSPKDLVTRMEAVEGEDPQVTKARVALAEVTKAVNAYEAEKGRLQKLIDTKSGVKKMKAANELEQLEKGPLMETLRRALITAEAAVRIAIKGAKKRAASAGKGPAVNAARNAGSLWWMQYDLSVKKRRYGKKAK